MINIDDVKPHLFGKKRIIFRKLFHFADKTAQQRLYFNRVVFFILKILYRYDNRFFLVDNFADFKTF